MDKTEIPDRLLRPAEVLKQVPWSSRTTILKLQKQGKFPPFVDLGNGQGAMLQSTLDAWKRSLPPKPVGDKLGEAA